MVSTTKAAERVANEAGSAAIGNSEAATQFALPIVRRMGDLDIGQSVAVKEREIIARRVPGMRDDLVGGGSYLDGATHDARLTLAVVRTACARGALALSRMEATAIETADVALMSDDLSKLPWLIRHSRRALRVIRQNLAWAALYNAACVPLALVGWLPPWAAGLGMAASSLAVVGNALRLSRVRARG